MGALSRAHANNLVDGSLGTSSFVATTGPAHVRIITTNGNETTNGTELTTGGGYTSGTGAPTVTFSAASGGTAASSSTITVTNMPACTVVGVEIWDSAGTPVRKWWGALTSSKTVNSGDTFSIAIAALTATVN